nr:unnamed protein product [Digitaria exilis]
MIKHIPAQALDCSVQSQRDEDCCRPSAFCIPDIGGSAADEDARSSANQPPGAKMPARSPH